MILDEVLQEENSSFDMDDMVDIFTEGFLYALEMQEAGYKAGSTEELSETIAEGADIAINELSIKYLMDKRNNASSSSRKHNRESWKHYAANGRLTQNVGYDEDKLNKKDREKYDYNVKMHKYHADKSNKRYKQAERIDSKIREKLRNGEKY